MIGPGAAERDGLGHVIAFCFGEDIASLGPLAAAGRFSSGRGEATKRDVMGDYLDALVGGYTSSNALTIAWDSGNGSAS